MVGANADVGGVVRGALVGISEFYQFILRSAAEAESIFLGNQPNTLDPTAPQGRTTRID